MGGLRAPPGASQPETLKQSASASPEGLPWVGVELTAWPRKPTILEWWPLILWIAVIFSLSSIPGPALEKVGFSIHDKLAHVLEYGVLGALTVLRRRGRSPRSVVHVFLTTVVLAAGVGSLDELYQRTVPGRLSSSMDLVADVAGAGLAAFLLLARRRIVRSAPNRAEGAPLPMAAARRAKEDS